MLLALLECNNDNDNNIPSELSAFLCKREQTNGPVELQHEREMKKKKQEKLAGEEYTTPATGFVYYGLDFYERFKRSL